MRKREYIDNETIKTPPLIQEGEARLQIYLRNLSKIIKYKKMNLINTYRNIVFVLAIVILQIVEAKADSNPSVAYSGTLPVLFINTDNAQPITDKEVYIAGSYYLDALNIPGYVSIGSPDEPLRLQIKGRGNWTWETYDKKPYRIKLDQKQALMGMNKNKHFVLLAHVEDPYAYLREGTAFELSRRIGMSYTPAEEPLEVVLNGDYIGLYFLTEKIRVDNARVNIVEQEDNDSVPEHVTGGWLLEIDAYPDEHPIILSSRDGYWFPVVSHSPEDLSDVQYDYLVGLVNRVDSLIYESPIQDCEWENYLDMDSLACFYIVNEVMDNIESFSGSCYIHKERGEDTKLIFGPVWDFGNSFNRSSLNYIYEENPIYLTHWLKGVLQFPKFRQCLRDHWNNFYENGLVSIDDFIDRYVEKIQAACVANEARWPQYGYSNLQERKLRFLTKLHNKIDFLKENWVADAEETVFDDRVVSVKYVDLNGRVYDSPHHGINLIVTTYESGAVKTVKRLLQ